MSYTYTLQNQPQFALGIYDILSLVTVRLISPTGLLWTAPEHLQEIDLGELQGQKVSVSWPGGSYKGDVYSFAIIVSEIVCRGGPYDNQTLDPEGIVYLVYGITHLTTCIYIAT